MLKREIIRMLSAFTACVVISAAISATCSIQRLEVILFLPVYWLGVIYASKHIIQRIGKILSAFLQAQLFRARILGALVLVLGLSGIVLLGWCNGIIRLIHSLVAAKKLDENIY